jgi:hypothetical protein
MALTPLEAHLDVVAGVDQRGQHLGQVGQRLVEHAAVVAAVQVPLRARHLPRIDVLVHEFI